MARYRVQGPDGRTYVVEGPEGATQEEVIAAAQNLAAVGNSPQITNSNASRVSQYKPSTDPFAARIRNDLTNDMNFGQTFAAGMGKSVYDTGRGIGQLAGAVTPEDVAEARQRDAPLSRTAGGVLGQVAGYGAQVALPGALAGAAAKGAQGVNLMRAASGARELSGLNAVANAANAARAASFPVSLTGNMAQGAALGYLQPVTEGESRGANALVGAGAGGLGYMVPGVLSAGKAALIDPLTDAGNERILARALQGAAQNTDNLMNPTTSKVRGYQPTLAEATLDPGIAAFQRALVNADPMGPVGRALDVANSSNNLARVRALEKVAGSVDAAKNARSAATAGLYDAARSGVAPVDDAFAALLNRPSMKEGMRKARKLAAESGDTLPKKPEQFTGAHLQYIDQALSDQIGKATTRGQKGYAGKLIATQQELRGWMEQSIPEYMQAQSMFRQMSRPVDQAKIGQEVLRRASSNSSDLANGVPIIRPDAAKGAIKKLGATAKAAGVKGNPRDILTKQQQAALRGVDESLDRLTFSQTAGVPKGVSATASNLAGMNALAKLGLPSGLESLPVMGRLAGVLDTAMKVANVPERLQVRLAQIVTNPAEAQRIIAALPENDQRIMARAMQAVMSQQAGARLAIAGSQSN